MSLDARQPSKVAEHSPEPGVRAVDSVAAPPIVGDTHGDSVFTVLEVDSAWCGRRRVPLLHIRSTSSPAMSREP
jgi:hypothetical protein